MANPTPVFDQSEQLKFLFHFHITEHPILLIGEASDSNFARLVWTTGGRGGCRLDLTTDSLPMCFYDRKRVTRSREEHNGFRQIIYQPSVPLPITEFEDMFLNVRRYMVPGGKLGVRVALDPSLSVAGNLRRLNSIVLRLPVPGIWQCGFSIPTVNALCGLVYESEEICWYKYGALAAKRFSTATRQHMLIGLDDAESAQLLTYVNRFDGSVESALADESNLKQPIQDFLQHVTYVDITVAWAR